MGHGNFQTMKTVFTLIIASLALFLSGCSTTAAKNGSDFLSKISKMGIVANDVTQRTSTPVYSHTESATGISKDTHGNMSIINLKVGIAVPVIGTTWDFSASGIQIVADPTVVIAPLPVAGATVSVTTDAAKK